MVGNEQPDDARPGLVQSLIEDTRVEVALHGESTARSNLLYLQLLRFEPWISLPLCKFVNFVDEDEDAGCGSTLLHGEETLLPIV